MFSVLANTTSPMEKHQEVAGTPACICTSAVLRMASMKRESTIVDGCQEWSRSISMDEILPTWDCSHAIIETSQKPLYAETCKNATQ